MNRGTTLTVALALALAAAPAQARETDDVGLGVAIGASVPMSTTSVKTGLKGLSFDWGFFVDIPLISSFYLTPSAMIYELSMPDSLGGEKRSVTDIDMNFKFVVPLGAMSIQGGVLAGLTSGVDLGEIYTAHAGLVAGLDYNLVSNLNVFVLANYKILFNDLSKVKNLHAYAGVMINL